MEERKDGARPEPEQARERHDEEPKLDSVTLARLLAEVRNEEVVQAHAYNRMHNRHNR